MYRAVLPEDIVIEVLLHIAPWEATTLKAASLVCRAWSVHSQRRLFSRVTVENEFQCRNLCNVLARCRHIGKAIAYFRIYRMGYDGWRGDGLLELAPFLTNVRELSVHFIKVSGVHRYIRDLVISNFPSIRILRLRYAELVHMEGLLHMIAGHVHLEQLIMENIEYELAAGQVQLAVPKFTLKRVLIEAGKGGDNSAMALIRWSLTNNPSHYPICPSTLQLVDVQTKDLALVGRFLRCLGPTLEHFYISVKGGLQAPYMTTKFSRCIDLSSNTKLRSVFVDESRRETPFFHGNLHDWLPRLVSTIKSSDFRDLGVGYGTCSRDSLRSVSWLEVAAALHSLPKLRWLTFWGLEPRTVLWDIVERGLQTLRERDVLRLKPELWQIT